MIPQFKLHSHKDLMKKLDEVINKGGEGLMLPKGDSYYKSGRSNGLLNVKRYNDTEAIVIQHIKGKRKFKNKHGSLLVATAKGIRLKIGTDFSDAQRNNPPHIGAIITYKYFGLTKNGIPRFASFIRMREDF